MAEVFVLGWKRRAPSKLLEPKPCTSCSKRLRKSGQDIWRGLANEPPSDENSMLVQAVVLSSLSKRSLGKLEFAALSTHRPKNLPSPASLPTSYPPGWKFPRLNTDKDRIQRVSVDRYIDAVSLESRSVCFSLRVTTLAAHYKPVKAIK